MKSLILYCLLPFGCLAQSPLITGSGVDWTSGSSQSQTLATGLLAYWKNDAITGVGTTTVDATGRGNDLTEFPSSGIWSSVSGVINNAVQLNGGFSAETFYHVSNSDLSAGVGKSFTLQCWVSFVNAFVGEPLIAKWDGTRNDYLLALNGSSHYSLTVADMTNHNSAVDSLMTATNTGKTHICCGYDDSLHQIWIQCDGLTRVTTSGVVGVTNTTVPFTFGNYSTNGASSLNGFLDECAVWNRSLSSSEVIQLYNSGAGLRPPGI